MKDQYEQSERLLSHLVGIENSYLEEAYRTTDANALRRLRGERQSGKRVGLHIGIWAACLLLAITLTVGGFLLMGKDDPQNPVTPPALPSTAGGEWLRIDSIDKLNYYTAMKIMADERGETTMPTATALATSSARTEPLSVPSTDGNRQYKELDPTARFTVTRVLYFQLELTDEKGFLASRIGTGVADVVITENGLENMITFKNGDRFYSCLCVTETKHDDGTLTVSFSTHKYIEGFFIVENLQQRNYVFDVLISDGGVRSIACRDRDLPLDGEDLRPDENLTVLGLRLSFDVRASFTVSDLEILYNVGVLPNGSEGLEGSVIMGLDGLKYVSNGDGTCYILGSSAKELGELVIPTHAPNGDRVTKIGEKAFLEQSSLRSVTIPEGVTVIGKSAFEGCWLMRSVSLPEGLRSIEARAFYWCESLVSVRMPDSVESLGDHAFYWCGDLCEVQFSKGLREIADYAFGKCSSLERIEIPSGVTVVGGGAFMSCIRLKDVILPSGLTTLGGSAFSTCEQLEEILLPRTLESVGGSAFLGCISLREIVLPDSVRAVYPMAFYGCTSLTSVKLPQNMWFDSIQQFVFERCDSLERIEIPATVRVIEKSAFEECRALSEIVLPSGVERVEAEAFFCCTQLSSVFISQTVQTLACGVFGNCDRLEQITVDEKNEFYASTGACLYKKDGTLIFLREGEEIPADGRVTKIGPYAFWGDNTSEIILPDCITEIGDYAFAECSYLSSLTLPKNLRVIGRNVFYRSWNIRELFFPSSMETVYAFRSAGQERIDVVHYDGTLDAFRAIHAETCEYRELRCRDGIYYNLAIVPEWMQPEELPDGWIDGKG